MRIVTNFAQNKNHDKSAKTNIDINLADDAMRPECHGRKQDPDP